MESHIHSLSTITLIEVQISLRSLTNQVFLISATILIGSIYMDLKHSAPLTVEIALVLVKVLVFIRARPFQITSINYQGWYFLG